MDAEVLMRVADACRRCVSPRGSPCSVGDDVDRREREVAGVPGQHRRVVRERRGGDERVGEAQGAAGRPGFGSPAPGEERDVRTRLDELDRLEEGLEVGDLPRLGSPGPAGAPRLRPICH
jgi:hypothetical protein